ncbi:MAG: tRNA pseudouridine(55) synthase TruB [Flavitalea sp.]
MNRTIFEEGQLLLIDKPYNWTSFAVIKLLRSILKIQKIGHAGTLDPLATGLLIVCTGKFTKKINDYVAQEKEYTGTITLGASTATFDKESEPENCRSTGDITEERVIAAANSLTGEIMQTPPSYSAIKIDGKRAYKLARQGGVIEMEARKVTINEFSTQYQNPDVKFKIVCSTGTYIRSMANDLGEALGCGGYLSSLVRSRIGDFSLTEARSMDETIAYIKSIIK